MKDKKTIILVGVVLLLVLSIGVTFAYFVTGVKKEGTDSNTNINTATVEDTILKIEGSINPDTNSDVYPGHKSISELKVTATGDINTLYNLVWTGTNTLKTTFKYYVYKTTTKQTPSITCNKKEDLVDGEYHYYEECINNNFTNLGEVISSGEISSSETETTVKLIKNERLQATKSGSTVYYYIVIEYPNEEGNQNLDKTGTFNGTTTVNILKELDLLSASEYLLAKNEMVHETFEDNGTTIDTGYRYEGANPNNYVTFNNETWRIIGVFDTVNADTNKTESLIKLIRNESIGNIAFDTEGEYGSNDWSESDLQTILNGQYYNGEDINYTYRNPSNSNISSTIAVSIIGKSLNETSRNMIQSVVWNLGGANGSSITASAMYTAERGTAGSGANPTLTTWPGYVGLMYPSDYGYAVDSTSCSRTIKLSIYYNTSSCKTNNWLFYGSYSQWTLTPDSSYSSGVLYVPGNGRVHSTVAATIGCGVHPSIYLKSNVKILDNGKDGSQSNPYDLVLS